MRFAVIGAGAIGGYLGARLAGLGDEVLFVARGAHLRAMQCDGLLAKTPDGELFLARPQASDVTDGFGGVDGVLVCVKMYDLAAALELVAPLLGPSTWVMTLQNGVDAPGMVGDAFGGERVVAGVAWFAGHIEAPGVLAVAGGMGGQPWLQFGAVGGSSAVPEIAERLKLAGVPAEAVDDAKALLWHKFCLISATSSAAALTRRPIGAIRDDPDMRWLLEGAVAETVAVANACGVNLPPVEAATVMALIDRMPAAATPSQLTDLLAGKPLELDWLSGTVRRLGRQGGVATPYHDVAYAALKPYRDGISEPR